MNEYFTILGKRIKFSDIKDFQIAKREYIYRPSFVEKVYQEKKFLKTETHTVYAFNKMVPYAAIIDETDRRGVLGAIKAGNYKESVGKELLGDIRETIGDKFNVKAIKGKKYRCLNDSDREFMIYLDEVPFLVMHLDGRIADVFPSDTALYSYLRGNSGPAVNTVYALQISTKEKNYIFWGNEIQVTDEQLQYEFQRLTEELELYKNETKTQKKLFGRSKTESIAAKTTKELPTFPKLSLPSFKKGEKSKTSKEQQITEIKNLYANGEISAEEYQERLQEIIDAI